MSSRTAQVAELVAATSARHQELHDELNTLSSIPHQVAEATARLGDMQKKLTEGEAKQRAIERAVTEANDKHKDLAQSKGRKIGHALIGQGKKFKAQQEQAERDHQKAVEEQKASVAAIEATKIDIKGQNEKISDLTWKLRKYDELARELDELYDRIFIADDLQDAVLVQRITDAQAEVDKADHDLALERQTMEHLNAAQEAGRHAVWNIKLAVDNLANDEEAVKYFELARTHATKYGQAIRAAKTVNSAVKSLPDIVVPRWEPERHDVQAVYLEGDNELDGFLYEDLMASYKIALLALKKFGVEHTAGQDRLRSAEAATKAAAARKEGVQQSLRERRRELFDDVKSGHPPPFDGVRTVQLPAYGTA